MNKPLHILTVIGARPQIIKASAISRAVAGPFAGRIVETLLHTGQHYDANMSQVFFDELGIPRPGIDLAVGSGSHAVQSARMLEGIERAILELKPDVVLLYGDTNSTLAGAIAASKLHVPVAHVEAGLRSFNKAMPEEINRIVCDHCSTWLFCPTPTALVNLEREGFPRGAKGKASTDAPHVLLSGDVMYDNSMYFAEVAARRSGGVRQELGLEQDGFVLATVHRDGNTDIPERLSVIVEALLDLQVDHGLPVVLPLHPRTRKRLDELPDPALRQRMANSKGFHVVPPAGFLDMVDLERHARLVVTDSGGVQKEAFFFGRPVVVLRPETEWVELVEHGQAILVDADPQRIRTAVDQFMHHPLPETPALYGDGHAAEHICEALLA
jgi:UDP-GlcNAc3NAcA epimerase